MISVSDSTINEVYDMWKAKGFPHYPNDYNNIEFYSPSTLDRAQCVK